MPVVKVHSEHLVIQVLMNVVTTTDALRETGANQLDTDNRNKAYAIGSLLCVKTSLSSGRF
jgi:hypothetical protein